MPNNQNIIPSKLFETVRLVAYILGVTGSNLGWIITFLSCFSWSFFFLVRSRPRSVRFAVYPIRNPTHSCMVLLAHSPESKTCHPVSRKPNCNPPVGFDIHVRTIEGPLTLVLATRIASNENWTACHCVRRSWKQWRTNCQWWEYSIPTENSLTFGIHMTAADVVATFPVSCCVKIIMVSVMFISALSSRTSIPLLLAS